MPLKGTSDSLIAKIYFELFSIRKNINYSLSIIYLVYAQPTYTTYFNFEWNFANELHYSQKHLMYGSNFL